MKKKEIKEGGIMWTYTEDAGNGITIQRDGEDVYSLCLSGDNGQLTDEDRNFFDAMIGCLNAL